MTRTFKVRAEDENGVLYLLHLQEVEVTKHDADSLPYWVTKSVSVLKLEGVEVDDTSTTQKDPTLALRNILMLALKLRSKAKRDMKAEQVSEFAEHFIRFCREGGVEPSILREGEE